ncbi:hypothetical protein RhiirA4_490039 [Rhizophagus irregularis]|uniref:Uncharacterized protein n=1 Tax=Rhizophagus irregularis TaxID=588596 RepID=A0A2I1HVA7_9GLOM|nr:hypothetical protein RhiirA4_490039 [Rhizophagus irregularis]
MANVRARVHALELADQRMSRLEERVFGHKQDDIPAPDPTTINKERAEIHSFQRSLDGKMDHLDASIHKLINSISGNISSGQADKASSD